MRDDLTAILMILDRSGSMSYLTNDTVGGFNNFINEQKKEPGEAVVTLVLFNHSYEVLYNAEELQKVQPLTAREYNPGGNTALLDAIGRGVHDLGVKLSAMDEKDRPGRVIVVIMTDGEENSSREYKRDQIKGIIEEQTKKYNWSFIFLGANIDAFSEAGSLGITRAYAANFSADSNGLSKGYNQISRSVKSYRSGGSSNLGNN